METVTTIRALLDRSNYAVEEALLRLYDRQTADEQSREATVERNGMGFGAFDAAFLSSLAVQVRENRRGYPKGQRLSVKQMALARRKVMRYAGQLALVANEKAAREHVAAGYHRCPDGVWRRLPVSSCGTFEGLCNVCEAHMAEADDVAAAEAEARRPDHDNVEEQELAGC